MSKLIYHERSWKGMFQRYEIYDDKIRIQSIIRLFSYFEIPFDKINKIGISQPLVFVHLIKQGYFNAKYAFGLRVIKNDLADLFPHLFIDIKDRYWRQFHFSPKNLNKFYVILSDAIQNYRAK